jgi:hypothetical protein
MSRDVSFFDIELQGVQYKAVEQLGCAGCSFESGPNSMDRCNKANEIVDCNSAEIIWVKKEPEQVTAPPKEDPSDIRSYNVGTSNYAKHKIQPWDIWLEYKLNPWDADIIKRVLRHKAEDPRRLDYEKIIHICQERIRQIDLGLG